MANFLPKDYGFTYLSGGMVGICRKGVGLVWSADTYGMFGWVGRLLCWLYLRHIIG